MKTHRVWPAIIRIPPQIPEKKLEYPNWHIILSVADSRELMKAIAPPEIIQT